jgi:ubiquinone/menaquinone biosynthesis C-methylase UbiE
VRVTKQLLAGAFGRAATTYDRTGPPLFTNVAARLITLADLGVGGRVLDVATGPGVALAAAAQLTGPAGLLVGVDLAEPMVAEARQRLQQAGVTAAQLAVMDAEALAFRAGVFDAVICASALQLLPRPVAALRGFKAVLRAGGTLAVAVFGADLDRRWAWRGALLQRLGPALDPLGQRFDQTSLANVLAAAGFRGMRVRVERLDVAYADAAEWWASDWSHGERTLLELMSPSALARYRRAAFRAIEACREPDGALHWRPEVLFGLAQR